MRSGRASNGVASLEARLAKRSSHSSICSVARTASAPTALLELCRCCLGLQPRFDAMTITESTRRQLFDTTDSRRVIRIDQKRHAPRAATTPTAAEPYRLGTWTVEEHGQFLEAMELYPSGPWKKIARHVGTRTPRQVMTHAQKYRQRLQRREASKGKAIETPSQKIETDKVLAVAVSPMPMAIPMPPAGTTGEIQVEAGLWVLPPAAAEHNARPAVFSDDPPPYGYFPYFEMDYGFLAHLAADPLFDDVDLTLPNADIEPLTL
jgi:SHAQKYF class myb-like DNA-binding protein